MDDRFRIEEQKLALATATAARGAEGDVLCQEGPMEAGPNVLDDSILPA